MPESTMSVLLMAARRRNAPNPVAEALGVTHKAKGLLKGKPLIQYVLEELVKAETVGQIYISVEDEHIFDDLPDVTAIFREHGIKFIESKENLFASVMEAGNVIGEENFPMMITAADNTLHTAEMVDHFNRSFMASDASVAAGMTPASVIDGVFPEFLRFYALHHFKDGSFSNCNIYGIKTPEALVASKIFTSGGQFRKYIGRVLKEFGLINMILYKYKLLTQAKMMERVSRVVGSKATVIEMPWAEAPIDVDSMESYAVVEAIIDRGGAKAKP